MWPSGQARVSKTLNDGSNPSMTAGIFIGKQSLSRAVFLYCPFYFKYVRTFKSINISSYAIASIILHFIFNP